jgi:hypothetical protein
MTEQEFRKAITIARFRYPEFGAAASRDMVVALCSTFTWKAQPEGSKYWIDVYDYARHMCEKNTP